MFPQLFERFVSTNRVARQIMSTISTYLGYRLYANNYSKSLQNVANEATNSTATAYYNANIGKVTSVDQFVGNYKLFSYAMTAFGLSDMTYANAFMKKVLESNLSDPRSFANTLSDSRYAAFARAFQFQTNGTVANTAQIQTSAQQGDIEKRFAANSTESASDQATDTAYYEKHIGSVTSIAGLEQDPTLYKYVLTAYGVDPSTPQQTVTKALESDLSDGTSFANASGNAGYMAMAADFNFSATGDVSSPHVFQSTAGIASTINAYSTSLGFDTTKAAASSDTSAQSAAKAATTYYEQTIPTITSLDQFLNDSKLTSYAIQAYGLPAKTTTAQLRSALTSDPNNMNSAASQLGTAFVTFAAAFNVSTAGTISRTPDVVAQNKGQVAATNSAYLENSLEDEAGTNQGAGVKLALYFRRIAPSITNGYQILADSALTKVVQTALSISSQASGEDIDTQANYLNGQLNYADFKNPQKLDQFIDRFSALYDVQNNTTSDPVLQLFAASSST